MIQLYMVLFQTETPLYCVPTDDTNGQTKQTDVALFTKPSTAICQQSVPPQEILHKACTISENTIAGRDINRVCTSSGTNCRGGIHNLDNRRSVVGSSLLHSVCARYVRRGQPANFLPSKPKPRSDRFQRREVRNSTLTK